MPLTTETRFLKIILSLEPGGIDPVNFECVVDAPGTSEHGEPYLVHSTGHQFGFLADSSPNPEFLILKQIYNSPEGFRNHAGDPVVPTIYDFYLGSHLEDLEPAGSYNPFDDASFARYIARKKALAQYEKPVPRELYFYKRADTEQFPPGIMFNGNLDEFISAHVTVGWLLDLAPGYEGIHEYRVKFGKMTDGTPWTDPGLVLQEYGIQISWQHRVKFIAKAFKAWEDGLSETDQAAAAITRKRTWWKTRIGYAWHLLDTDDRSITVISAVFGSTNSRNISGTKNVMTWATDDLERLAGAGVGTFNPADNLLESLLDEPTLAKINADNSFGEGVQGTVDAADWTAYQTTHFQAALDYA